MRFCNQRILNEALYLPERKIMENSQALKNLVIHDSHTALGGKMVPFAGYNMPIQYKGLKDEHLAVRSSVGVFDVSHMGEFQVKGPEATQFLQWVTSNDVEKLEDGKIQYSCMPNDKGGIVDDLLVYRWNSEEYTLVVNASNEQKDWDWLNANNKFDCTLENISDQVCLFAVQGPNAIKVVQKLTETNLDNIPYYSFEGGSLAGAEDVVISNTGYTGAGGFELYVWNKDAQQVWDAILDAGAEFDIEPAGLGARDTLRLEKGFCLYGNDINDSTSPIEAGIGGLLSLTKISLTKNTI
jgi:aminomethyltransferase